MTERKKIRVAIVDDHTVVRDGIAAMLESKKDFTVPVSFSSGTQLVEEARKLPLAVDVIVMDIRMPGLDGLETLKRLGKTLHGVRCMLLAGMPLKVEEDRARELGAAAYLPKTTGQNELADAIRRIASGEDVFITENYVETPQTVLSAREFAVLDSLRRGLTREATARELGLSLETVKTYMKNIFAKLEADNIASAINRAYELGVFCAR